MSLFRKLVGVFQAAGLSIRKRLLGGGPPVFIEEVFNTFLYTGTDANQTITNGIDLSTKGGLVWTKPRNIAQSHQFVDTVRGQASILLPNSTNAASVNSGGSSVNSFLTTGYVAGVDFSDSTRTYCSWTFRKQPKFFDVVTYTGTGSGVTQTINHTLGSAPGFMLVKSVSSATYGDWSVYHRSLPDPATNTMYLDNGGYYGSDPSWASQNPTSTTFSVRGLDTNDTGVTYVAYLFAHNAGGFGLTGNDNVISCGSYTGNGNAVGPVVNLGYEPQFVIIKKMSSGTDWEMYDNMRGVATGGNDRRLIVNSSGSEEGTSNILSFTSTGFQLTNVFSNTNGDGNTYIYIAIRRGPMKVPTVGTSVFYPTTYTGTGSARTFSGFGFPPDFEFSFSRGGSGVGDGNGSEIYDKLRGTGSRLLIPSTDIEFSGTEPVTMLQDGISVGATVNSYINYNGFTKVLYALKRAPSFFDVVCWNNTTNSGNDRIEHSLGVPPELIITKQRNVDASWYVYNAPQGRNVWLRLNATSESTTSSNAWGTSNPTDTDFGIASSYFFGAGSKNHVAFLFATCAGVSKVGSYTGTATTKQIDCGFTGGARFVLIKRTDSTGDWYVWDTARGIIAGNDPYLLLNSTAAESTATDYIDPYSPGFELSSTAPAAINASGGTFIFLAIA